MTTPAWEPYETDLAAAVARGERADFSARRQAGDVVVVRGATIRALLTQPAGTGGVYRGVQLSGARIEGPLDLNDLGHAAAGCLAPLALAHCTLTEPLTLNNAHISRLELSDCRIVS